MSRTKNFARALASGYATVAANVVYTLGAGRLGLHYLSNEELGIWVTVVQISGNLLLLVDLGMSGSMSRILIDHKDDPAGGAYGSVIKTGWLVLLAQGAILAGGGVALSFWMPDLFKIPPAHSRDFQLLVAGQFLVTGAFLASRMFGHVLQAHQRYDAQNYSQLGSFGVNLGVMWLGFRQGMGLYSLLLASVAGQVFSAAILWLATACLRLLPPAGAWGQAKWSTFKGMFLFGSDLFLLFVGFQLTSASQLLIITRTLGLDAATTWSYATKSFVMAQQVVWSLWTYSASAVSEMVVRQERARLHRRFREIVLLTASAGVLGGVLLAVCNGSFLHIWTAGRIAWSVGNDCLLAVLLLTNCVSRCHVGLTGQTKQIRGMRYIYFVEGLCFVVLAFLAAPRYGMTGILVAAIAMNLLWSGAYGVWRTAQEFQQPVREVAFGWIKAPVRFLFLVIPLGALCWWLTRGLLFPLRLALNTALVSLAGLILLWLTGLTPELRAEAAKMLANVKKRLRPA